MSHTHLILTTSDYHHFKRSEIKSEDNVYPDFPAFPLVYPAFSGFAVGVSYLSNFILNIEITVRFFEILHMYRWRDNLNKFEKCTGGGTI